MRAISDVELVREFFRYFGTAQAFHLVGYLMLYGVAGRHSANEILEQLDVALPGERTQFDQFAKMRAFAQDLRSRGLYVVQDDIDDDLRPLARQIVDLLGERTRRARLGGETPT